MRTQDFDDAVAMGRANAEAIELTRRHCRHARIEHVGGNSMAGAMLGLPMGLLEVRCEHAPPPRTQSHRALELALSFYEANCSGCPHRDGNGMLPNLATVAGQRAADLAEQREAEVRATEERADRYRARTQRRQQSLAGEGHVVRELAAAVDGIDRADPRTQPLTSEEVRAARQVMDAARGAPELFSPILVDTLLELAADAADATALDALGALVRGGRCPPRRALECALSVLRRGRSVEAGRLLAALEPDLRPDDLPPVMGQLIALGSGEDDDPWRPPPSPEGLIAASRIDLTVVTGAIIEHLASDDDETREAGADAAGVLLAIDPARVIALGPPLAMSVRGADAGYAGEPHATGSALRALAEAWRGEPTLTRNIIEAQEAILDPEARDELSRTPWFLQRFREPWDASAEATAEAVSFVVRRAGGDWGDEAADHAAEHLVHLASDLPAEVGQRVHEVLGAILPLCAPDRDASPVAIDGDADSVLANMERESLRIRRDARRRRLAQAVGRCAHIRSADVVASVRALFTATTGDQEHDRAVRTTMIDLLEEAASPETLRDLLPIAYSALLDGDQTVRAAGIDLWVACAGVTDTLPGELIALSEALLQDRYVIVHRRMLRQLPRLQVTPELAARLLPIVASWVITYTRADDADGLTPALWALRALATSLEDDAQTVRWYRVALMHVGGCDPRDREDLLTAWWPDELRDDPAWARAALATAATPELIDYYNQRHEPLLQALFDRPQLLTGMPFADIQPLSVAHAAGHVWRAVEPIELLQGAGRWADAATVARGVESAQPPGAEGEPGRRLAGAIARGAELAQLLAEGPPSRPALRQHIDAASAGITSLEASIPEGGQNGHVRALLDTLLVLVTSAEVLLEPIIAEPAAAAGLVDSAGDMLAATPSAHAPGQQRHWIARAFRIAALLLRYDDGTRTATPDAYALLEAAQRQAEVLLAGVRDEVTFPGRANLTAFLERVREIGGAGDAQAAWQLLAFAPPPVCLMGTSLLPRRHRSSGASPSAPDEPPRAVCVATMRGVPVTDVLVVRPRELYHLGMTVRLVGVPAWAETCVVEPVTTLGRDALALPRYEFRISDGTVDEFGLTLTGDGPLHCAVAQPIQGPALDCPLQVRLIGVGHDEVIEAAGCRRLRLRPFDPSRDALTEHEQTDERLLRMFARLDAPEFDTEDVRAFCRLFAASVRAAQTIMFEKVFRRGSRVTEAQFHDEFERLLRDDPELEAGLTRRDAVAGGFDDLLHDDVIAELKVARGAPISVADCARYVGQPTQYGVGRGSQISVLVVLDHGRKLAPPGVIDNYIGWLSPRLHGLDDPRYPSLVGVLIVNTNLPVPSAWSRRRIELDAD